MICPHCKLRIPQAEVLADAARNLAKMRKTHGGGRPRSTAPRCRCGLMTAKRAKARNHRC